MARLSSVFRLFQWAWVLPVILGDLCPYKECQCAEDVIECGNLNLKTLPTLIVTQVFWEPYLSLTGNFITNITSGGLPSGLGGIDFEGNPITWVDENAFSGSEDTLYDLKFSGVNLDDFPFALFDLTNLQHLSILNSQIRQWDPTLLYYLGKTLKTLTLVDVGLTKWPEWIQRMSYLTVLEFSSAQISIPDDAFDKLTQVLTSITLKNVTLTSTGIMFSKLVALKDIMLDNNLITQVTGLPDFGNLSTIFLNNNSITDKTNLTSALLPVADSLESLYLNLNKLTSFPDLSFLTQVETLFITDNKLYNTREGVLPPNILSLSLENNRITSISNFMRNGLKLETAKLGLNYINQIQGVDIPISVTDIDFTSNLISQLNDISFPLNSAMTTLTLDNNPLYVISTDAFVNLQQLTYLSIKGSKLTRLPTSIGLINTLKTLDLSGNAGLVCTCLEQTLRPWAVSVSTVIFGDCGLASIDYFLRTLSADCPN